MTAPVVFTTAARVMFAAIKDRREQGIIAGRIDELAANPMQLGKPLDDVLAGYRSVRAVGQRYRIIYRVTPTGTIYIVAIGLRREGSPNDIYVLAQRLAARGKLGPP